MKFGTDVKEQVATRNSCFYLHTFCNTIEKGGNDGEVDYEETATALSLLMSVTNLK
jgi:hypothetical protein